MSLVNRIATYALGLFLVSTGHAKFTRGHLFQYIEYQSGIDLLHPFLNHITGVAEIVLGLLILVRRTRLIGAAGAALLMLGAIALHLSPWLGVSSPTGLVDGATAPWTADDFTTTTSSVTFFLAVVVLGGSLAIVRQAVRARRRNRLARPDLATAGEPVGV